MSAQPCGAMGSTKLCDRPETGPGQSCGKYGHDAESVRKGKELVELMSSENITYGVARRRVNKVHPPAEAKPKRQKKDSVPASSACSAPFSSSFSFDSPSMRDYNSPRSCPLPPSPRPTRPVEKSKFPTYTRRPDTSKTVSMFSSIHQKCDEIDSVNLATYIRVKDLAPIPAAAVYSTSSYCDSTPIPNASIQKLSSDLSRIREALQDVSANPNVDTEVNVAAFANEQHKINSWLVDTVDGLSLQLATISLKLPTNAEVDQECDASGSQHSMDLS